MDSPALKIGYGYPTSMDLSDLGSEQLMILLQCEMLIIFNYWERNQ